MIDNRARDRKNFVNGRGRSGGLLWMFLFLGPRIGFSFSVDPSMGVRPVIFSPNGDGINDVVCFSYDNSTESFVSGSVSDLSGAHVATLVPASLSDRLIWNGRDEGGRLVPPGPYLYQILGGGTSVRGVVVVVR